MEKFVYKQFRDGLKKNLLSENDREKRRQLLEGARSTPEYQMAQEEHFRHDIFRPTSRIVNADKEAEVEIGKQFCFSEKDVARQFCKMGMVGIEASLPKKLSCADIGGGAGVLAEQTKEWLEDQGHDVSMVVVDGNSYSLDQARSRGLRTEISRLDELNVGDLDLIVMRAVLHYNDQKTQEKILNNIFYALKGGGYFVSQHAYGNGENSMLRDMIASMAIDMDAKENIYHWPTMEDYKRMLVSSGFEDFQDKGYVTDNVWGPEYMWDRFYGQLLRRAQDTNDNQKMRNLEIFRKEYLRRSNEYIKEVIQQYGAEHVGVRSKDDESYEIVSKYRIVSCRKPK